jgi:transcriptional regulator EpsA
MIQTSANWPVNSDRQLDLASSDMECLLSTVAESLKIRRRHHFFDWSQGKLQSLIPHGVLVCGVPRTSGPRMFFDYFYNIPLPTTTLARLCHPRFGIGSEMVDLWRAEGGDPAAFHANGASTGTSRISVELESLGLGSAIAHGIPNPQGGCGAHCFFMFVALQRPPQARDSAIVQMIVPHLFVSYCRALLKDQPPGGLVDTGHVDAVITEREVEIMRWVREGKSNQEIGVILGISPLTVKNHVQKILRKLQASNRTQAVAKAIALKLLSNATMTVSNERSSLPVSGVS